MAQEEAPVGLPHILLQNTAVGVPIIQDEFESEEFFEEEEYFDDDDYMDEEEEDWDGETGEEAVGLPVQQQPVPAIQQQPVDLTPDPKTSVEQFQYGWGAVTKFFEENPQEITKQAPVAPAKPVSGIGDTLVYIPQDVIITERVVAVKAQSSSVSQMICRKCGQRKVMDNSFNVENVEYWMKGHVQKCWSPPQSYPIHSPKTPWAPGNVPKKLAKYCQAYKPEYHLHCKGEFLTGIPCECNCHTQEEFPDEVL